MAARAAIQAPRATASRLWATTARWWRSCTAASRNATNNVAEYNGLLAALAWAVDQGLRSLHIRSDSELLVKQLRGEYRVKNPGLQPLYQDARALVGRIGRVTFEHVRRELNKEADRLANLAMDEAAAACRQGFGEP